MKKLLGLALLALAVPAFADIPAPPAPANLEVITLEGADAAELAEALDANWQIEASLRTYSSSVKVFQSSTNLTQIVCHKSTRRLPSAGRTNSCTISKSTNGQPIPTYIVRVRMG